MYDDHYSHPSNYYRRNDDRSPERGDRKRKSKSRERSPGSSNYKKRRFDEEREDYRGSGGGGGYHSSSSNNYRRSEGNNRRDDNRRGSYNNRGNNRNSRGGNNNNRYSAGSNKGRSSYGTSNVDIYEGPLKPFELYKQSLDDYLSYEELQRKFKEYVEEYMRRCAQKFYRDHRDEEWFKERYHPNNLNQSHQSLLEIIKNRANKFIEDNANNTLQVPPLDVERFLEYYQQHHAEEYDRSQQIKDVEAYEEEVGPTDSVLKPDPSIQAVVGDNDAVHYLPFPPHTLFIATVHPNLYKEEIYSFLNSVEESPLLSLTLSKPTNKRGWTRQGWASYSTQEQAENAMRVLNEKEIKQGYKLALVPYTEKVRAFRQALPIFRSPERMPKDIKQCQDLIGKLDEMRELYTDNSNPILERKQEENDTDFLDRLIHYLRTVHFFCYYSLKEVNDENELNFQCGKYYLRSKPSEEEVANAKRILEAFDKRFESKKNRFREPSVFTGKKAKEDSNNTFLKENYSELSKEKFKCKICSKAFKAVNYIEKHIYTKHSEEMDKEVERAIDKLFLENYLSDFERPNITPQRAPSPPPPSFSSGNSAHQSQRTPRSSHKNKQYNYQEEEDEEDEIDTRLPSDYLEIDHSVNGVPSLDYYLGIFNK